jgi:protein-tyrosine phosphatase
VTTSVTINAMSTDPTRINIETDPFKQRMRGTAIHGDTPFDVPYVTKIADNLWQGGCTNGLILPKRIKHLVSLYPWEAYTVTHELDSYMSVRMYDSIEQAFEQVKAISQWVDTCRDSGPVLVHCQAGLNRSSLIVAHALMLAGISSRQAIDMIRAKRSPACLCNPSFEEWLLSLDAPRAAA